jgi:L-ascorbate metabolism protein UlaG (beta-lactamase superfamily)
MTNIDQSYLTYYAGPQSDHFDGTKFFNPWGPSGKKGFMDFVKWRFGGTRAAWPEKVENPLRPPIQAGPETFQVTYIGHATLLIRMNGVNIITDPLFSERASPFASIGPKRVRAPFIPLEMLPKIDYVFISHNHYDHLDLASLSWLARNHKPVMITPLGNTRLMEPCADGCSMVALDWYQNTPLKNNLSLNLVPSQHWSRRGFNDINRDLWGGMFLKSNDGKGVYYSGDTGFHAGMFEDIAKRYGGPDIALLPIGAYEPRWFMKYSHMNPDDAARAHAILKPKKSMGFHFETFQLTDEAFDTPRKDMGEALKKHKIPTEDFVIPYPGDFVSI